MIAKLPEMLLILLALLTILGLVIGYCIASIQAKRKAHRVMESERARLRQVQRATMMDLQSAKNSLSSHRKSDNDLSSLESQTKAQAKRIKHLEAQVRELKFSRGGSPKSQDKSAHSTSSNSVVGEKSASDAQDQVHGDMIQQLSPELEIPDLDESEMPELADDLEFDIFDRSEGGSTSRG